MNDAQLWGDAARWYSDVVELGAAHHAWQAEFDRIGSPFRVRARDPANPRTATIANGERAACLILSPRERRFVLTLGSVLDGHAPDLAAAAAAAQAWLMGARASAGAGEWPFLGSVALAAARECGDHREAGWLRLYENHRADPVAARLRPFVALAFHEPRLRRLTPYTNHRTLHFSTTTNWPYTDSHPRITPAETLGHYIVTTNAASTYTKTDAPGALHLILTETPG